MTRKTPLLVVCLVTLVSIGISDTRAKNAPKPNDSLQAQLTDAGKLLEGKYAAALTALKAEIIRDLPALSEQKKATLQKAQESLKAAIKQSANAAEPMQDLGQAQGLVKHGQWWTSDAKKQIAKAQASLKAATTDAARQAAQKTIDEQQKRYDAGVVALKEREAALEAAKAKAATAGQANDAAKAALVAAQAAEINSAKALVADMEPFIASDKLDEKLVKATVLSAATPAGLAFFAQKGKAQETLIDQLLADAPLMKEVLLAGGALHGNYGRAIEIFSAIKKASPRAAEKDGVFHRLALATSLEFATPIQIPAAKAPSKKSADDFDAPDSSAAAGAIDPVKRYLAYESAYLKGELDPAFKTFNAWEYRMVVGGEATDQELAWGREMIRNYRPDYVSMPNYGWRYSALVKSDVTYGSENCKFDRPELNFFQNILKDGGVCGRRAFFGRFILRANGIPVWGVTQHKHAALSHWTPKGWVINLGAGFDKSWWDKSDTPMSGSDFLLETQARSHPEQHVKILRAQWVSRILGEQAYNGRKDIAGGLWSSLAHYLVRITAASEVELKPLGQELAEANAPAGSDDAEQAAVTKEDQKISVSADGKITLPAVAHGKASGSGVAMKSHGGGMQLLGSAGFKTRYEFDAPRAGKYTVSARVVTVQDNRKISLAANDAAAVEIPVAYTTGLWQQTQPIELTLNKGKNSLKFEVLGAGRLAIKDFTLKPVN